MHTLNRLQMRNLALDAIADFHDLTGQSWTVYPAHILLHWRPDRPLDQIIPALREDGHLTLARLVAQNCTDQRQFVAVRALYQPQPTDSISQAEFSFRLGQLAYRPFIVQEALALFWSERSRLDKILSRIKRRDPRLAFALAVHLFGKPMASPSASTLTRVRSTAVRPRLLDRQQMKAAARQIVHELNLSSPGCYTQSDILRFWSATTEVLSIELAMHEVGEHLLARLFSEFVLIGAELRLVLETRRPGRLDRLSQGEMRRISRQVHERTGVDIRPLWSPRLPIQHLSSQLDRLYGPRVAQEFAYWSLHNPGYLL